MTMSSCHGTLLRTGITSPFTYGSSITGMFKQHAEVTKHHTVSIMAVHGMGNTHLLRLHYSTTMWISLRKMHHVI